MSLPTGTTLGPYEILALLGRGGMGEVYRARDHRLDRDVAIKILPPEFAKDPDRRSRFEREAKAVAALSHPNILAIFDVGVADDTAYAVTELLTGQSLREALSGPLPIRKAIEIAIQVARGLAAAHDKSLIHRDLKPENIFLLADGQVKILDFGLARQVAPESQSGGATTMAGTDPGTVMGTVGYMPPEQVRGLPLDTRADLFALGAVLYEMLTGRRAFEGATPADTITAVLTTDPPELSLSRPDVPAGIDRIIRHCLEKNPAERFRTASDVGFALDAWSASGPTAAAVTAAAATMPARRSWAWSGWAVAAVVAALALVFGMLTRKAPTPPADPIRFQVMAPGGGGFMPGSFAVSPDGRRLAFQALGPDGLSHVWLRSLDVFDATMLPGTQGGAGPFWSPDSRILGFWAEGKLKRLNLPDGTPEVICSAGNRGASWGSDGTILFATNSVFAVPASGGAPVPVTQIDPARQEIFHGRPFRLPDGRHFLYVRVSTLPENTGIYVGSLDVKPAEQSLKRVMGGQIGPAFLETPGSSAGRLFFLRDHRLLAQGFDPNDMALRGDPSVVAEPIGDNGNAIGFFSVSRTAVAFRGDAGSAPLAWFDQQGKIVGQAGEPAKYFEVEFSPDGTLAAAARYGANTDIWIIDLARSANTRFTTDIAWDQSPVWSPDGRQIVFASSRKQPSAFDLYRKPADRAHDEELLLASSAPKYPLDWSRDGRFLIYVEVNPTTGPDLWVLENPGGAAADRKTTPFLITSFRETQARFSPDGRWVAYASDESGRSEIYVRPFPAGSGGAPRMISTAGGVQPRWRRDGRGLFYLSPASKLMAVAVKAGPSFEAGAPAPLFTLPIVGTLGSSTIGLDRWDASADGQRFLAVTSALDAAQMPISVIAHWRP